MYRLFTMDTKALNYVLMNSNDYQKPVPARYNLSRIVGNGVYTYTPIGSLLYTANFASFALGILVVEGSETVLSILMSLG